VVYFVYMRHGLRLLHLLIGLSPLLPAQLLTRQEVNKVSSGYVFVSPMASNHSYLLNNSGEIVKKWTGNVAGAIAVKMLPNGNIIRMEATVNNNFPGAVGMGGAGLLEELDWAGRVVWSYTLSNDRYLHHHDFVVLPNGNLLLVAWERRSPEEARAAGRDPNKISPEGVWSEAVLEVKPTRPAGGEIVWEWHAWDHLVQDIDATKANFGVVAGNAAKLDINFIGPGQNAALTANWLHINSVDYHAERDEIVLGSRLLSEIWIIPHGARRNGDFLYRWGNPQVYRMGTDADQKLFFQHHAQWIPQGYPGEGHILILNNGVGRGYTSADEIVLPAGYAREPGKPFGPAQPVWTVGEKFGGTFFTLVAGSVQRMPNGNTVLGLSNAARAVEVTPEGEIVWDMNLSIGETGGFSYRVTRLEAATPGLAATSLSRAEPKVVHAASRKRASFAPGLLIDVETSDGAWTITDATGARFPLAGGGRFALPGALAVGPARLSGATTAVDVRVDEVSPGLFSLAGNGAGAGVILAVERSPKGVHVLPAWSPLVASADLFLVYGTGLRGKEVAVSIGGVAVPVWSVGVAEGLPGVDVVTIGPLPAELDGRGVQNVVVTVNGESSNAVTVRIPD
jgi:hypothetical protein